MKARARWWLAGVAVAVTAALVFAGASWQALMPLPATLHMGRQGGASVAATHVVAADGTPLNLSFDSRFNRADVLPASAMPLLLRHAFVAAEDHRYWQHGGVDWRARFTALWQNLRAGRIVRGASTIGEQAARILEPRPHTYWSHWVAGLDAARLLQRFGHAQVMAFYLNQVPYGANRRGVAQAARYYFGRDVRVLNPAQQLALAVLVRSPVAYDPRRHPAALRRAVTRLARQMRREGVLSASDATAVARASLAPTAQALPVTAGPFVVQALARARARHLPGPTIHTTLDPALETFVQQTLRTRVASLAGKGVRNGAALVVDNRTGAVLAWAVAPKGSAYAIDPVITPRQPGSALKPFVYGLAMARLGWQADHVIMDTPLTERVQQGVHRYRNYSGRHYGRVSLRYALANSLNIPAIRTAQAVGPAAIVRELQHLGFSTLRKSADYYGPAIALGDGAVTLFDMVQGYASLARHGRFLPIHVLADHAPVAPVPVLPGAVTSLLANILSDPNARAAEFGADSVLDLPEPTAIKTGTSSDYHDLWTLGFDNRYTVGVWMGNLEGAATQGLTGSMGPAPVLRRIFAHLRGQGTYAGLWHSPQLQAVRTCEWIGPPPCIRRQEWYVPRGSVVGASTGAASAPIQPVIVQPVDGETLAIDPRLPRSAQQLTLRIDTHGLPIERIDWRVDGHVLPDHASSVDWPLVPGKHQVSAAIWLQGRDKSLTVGPVSFDVAGKP
ncbi:MAG TPA: transglycosylase domain-containing protein [Rhodanobacteraceae bacterium]